MCTGIRTAKNIMYGVLSHKMGKYSRILMIGWLLTLLCAVSLADAEQPQSTKILPLITVQPMSGGVNQITVSNVVNAEEKQKVVVKVDAQGNREVMIVTTDAANKEHTSVIGKDTEVPVTVSSRVSIGEDGTLVRNTHQAESN